MTNLDLDKEKMIESVIASFLEEMGFDKDSTISIENHDEHFKVNINSEQSKFLIGKGGNNLHALQHLIRIITNKKSGRENPVDISIDINNYKQDQKRSLKSLALEIAAQVTAESKTIVMEPMNSYQRRLIHLELENFKGVVTESIGEGDDRKVVVKPESVSHEMGL